MNELEFRGQALEAALRTSEPGETADRVLERARDYYQFLSGKSPDHNPAPVSPQAA